ncbi:o-succinylbenzoate synthase [Coraliomargarita sinensis]|uniref:o-succinylbenzoate synthase n=1 Tax=Coraliomargarita sinensis TaxID=2174842 RepID=A0A317ZG98_9BACT|nr:o-succinylbenzoate synthase [Coraliomargarita sinensis]PXA02958.1 o-succinylbenzoate synthase [Coraliomargarita sinensis]
MNLKVAYRSYRRDFLQPLRTAHGQWKVREGFILRLESESAVAYGEIAPIPDFGTETVERAANFLKQWAADPIIMPSGLPCCTFALTTALQQLKQPATSCGRDYRVAGLLPAGPDALDVAKKKLAGGYTTLKWKIAVHEFEAEREILSDLLQLLPEKASIRLDANGGLGQKDLENWLEVLGQNDDQIDYLEQPLPAGEERAMAELSKASNVPIALDESLNMPGRERWLTPDAWKGPLVIKPLLMGNVSPLLEQLRPLAGQLVFSSVFETGIGLFQALDLADNLPDIKYAIGFDTIAAFDDDLSGLVPGPIFPAGARAKIDLESIWNQLPHSS